jgi:antitoxin MazE
MKAVVKKWGNSLGLRLPGNLTGELHIKDGSTLELLVEDGKIILLPKKKSSLRDKLKLITDENIHEEVNTGKIVGNEIW